MDNLKPCPFCGGEAEILDQPDLFFVFKMVKCKKCLLELTYCEDKEEAVRKWNTRYEDRAAEARCMKANDYHPLQEYLETLPEPKTFREKLLCWWSNLIDSVSVLIFKANRRRRNDDAAN